VTAASGFPTGDLARAKECYEHNKLVGRELQPILEQSAQSHVESGSTSGRNPKQLETTVSNRRLGTRELAAWRGDPFGMR
jgi:hypothetical protein